MPFKHLSAVASGHQPPITPGGPELVRARFGQSLAVADFVVGTIGVIGILPAGTLPAHLYVRVPVALGANFKASVGVLDEATGDISTKPQDGGGAWLTDATTGGAAAGYVQVVPAPFGLIEPKDYDRQLVLKITGAGATAGLYAVDLVYANA